MKGSRCIGQYLSRRFLFQCSDKGVEPWRNGLEMCPGPWNCEPGNQFSTGIEGDWEPSTWSPSGIEGDWCFRENRAGVPSMSDTNY